MDLTNAHQANGLYKLAQQVGQKIGDRWKAFDSCNLQDLKKRFIDVEALKKQFIEENSGNMQIMEDFSNQFDKFIKDYDNQMTMKVADAYVRISKQVAMELVEPLLSAMRKEFVPVIVRKINIREESDLNMQWNEKKTINRLVRPPVPVAPQADDPQSPPGAVVKPEEIDVNLTTAVPQESGVTIAFSQGLNNPGVPDNIDI